MDQSDVLRRLLDVLEGLEIRHMVTGSWASMVYGEPRLTQDIDVVVELTESQAIVFCRYFPSPEYYVSEEAARQAVRTHGQFNIIHPESGNKIDVLIARQTPWGFSEIRRRQRVKVFPDLEGFVARPEDVIIGKLLYYQEGGSEKHLRDITGILRTSGDLVDRAYVENWARDLGVMEPWQAVLRRLEMGAQDAGR